MTDPRLTVAELAAIASSSSNSPAIRGMAREALAARPDAMEGPIVGVVTQPDRNQAAIGALVTLLARTLGRAATIKVLEVLEGEHDDEVRIAMAPGGDA